MKILKHGDPNAKKYICKCYKCGCIFECKPTGHEFFIGVSCPEPECKASYVEVREIGTDRAEEMLKEIGGCQDESKNS